MANGKNPWSKREPSDGISVLLQSTDPEGSFNAMPSKRNFVGPPTEQDMIDDMWKEEVLRNYYFGGSDGIRNGSIKGSPQ